MKLQGRNTDGTYINNLTGEVTLSKDIGLIYIQVVENTTVDETVYPMITLSTETNTDYEPYGYKLPIVLGGVTTNVYLGEVQSTRRIRKLVFDGTEDWNVTSGTNQAAILLPIAPLMRIVLCSHYTTKSIKSQ